MAVTLTGGDLAGVIGASTANASRLLAIASALVERYASDAPEAVQNEAVIRFAGYLEGSRASGFGAWSAVEIGGGLKVDSSAHHAAAFRNSGAAALLGPWRTRHCGIIGDG